MATKPVDLDEEMRLLEMDVDRLRDVGAVTPADEAQLAQHDRDLARSVPAADRIREIAEKGGSDGT